MRPRNPTPEELKIVADKVPKARAEIKAKELKQLYERAFATIMGAGSSTGQPTEEGYRETVQSYLKKYKKVTIDGEKYDVGFFSSQTATSSELEGVGRHEF